MTEATLLEGLRGGNPAARAFFLQQHQDAVYSYFRYLPMDPAAAQEAAIVFFQKILKKRPGPRIPVWLYQQLLQEPLEIRPFPHQSPTEEGFRRLPEELRRILFLREIAGLSTEDAATVLGIPVALARTRLGRARAEL
jgi:DNA-directed RNA polymerase specialized sigma24 family protein